MKFLIKTFLLTTFIFLFTTTPVIGADFPELPFLPTTLGGDNPKAGSILGTCTCNEGGKATGSYGTNMIWSKLKDPMVHKDVTDNKCKDGMWDAETKLNKEYVFF